MTNPKPQNRPEHIDLPGQPGVHARPAYIKAGRFTFSLGQRTIIMGVLNVTPDSFSDGGLYVTPDQALRRAEQMLAEGADILDIGGESTRPGSQPVSLDEEMHRVIPVLEKVCRTFDCAVSIDSAKSAVAEEALRCGACIVNDINGLQQDPDMAAAACRLNAAVVMMHNARLYRSNQPPDQASGTLADGIHAFLTRSCRIAVRAGLKPEQMIIDPGVGFGVTPEESIQMIAELNKLADFHLPILLGPSRKRFIGHILNLPADRRLNGTSAAVAIGIANGADIIRVHDVREMTEVARVADALCRGTRSGGGSEP